MFYNLDVIIAIGYRVNSKRGTIFRKCANQVLKEYLLKGYVINENRVTVSPKDETIWITANQMAVLFVKDEKTIRKHINNIFNDGELKYCDNTQKVRVVGVNQFVTFYSLNVIISVGYRVKSYIGVKFRIWANQALKEYLLKGYVINENRVTVEDHCYKRVGK